MSPCGNICVVFIFYYAVGKTHPTCNFKFNYFWYYNTTKYYGEINDSIAKITGKN